MVSCGVGVSVCVCIGLSPNWEKGEMQCMVMLVIIHADVCIRNKLLAENFQISANNIFLMILKN